MIMSSLRFFDYVVMALYLVALIVIGVLCSSRKSNTRDYLLGGGKMPFLALGISCLMAALSAFSLVMVPGEIYNHGLSFWVPGLFSPLLVIGTTAIFMRFYFKIGAYTPFEYLGQRYSPAVRSLVAGMTIYLRLIYLGMVLFSTSKILEGAAGWPCWVTILLCGTVSVIFTTVGGLRAVVWTDVMQFIVLIGGLFCILGALFLKVDGGLCGGIACAFEHGRGLDEFANPDFYRVSPYVRLSFWLLLIGNFVMVPLSIMASDQMTVQRLLASGNYKNAMKTQIVNTLLQIPTTLILFVIGLLVFAFFHQHPDLAATVKSGDTALFQFIATQLPTPLPGLVIAGMLAAAISTLNAVLNSMAAVYVKELHIHYIAPTMSEEKQVFATRLATILIGVFSGVLGLVIAYAADWLSQSVVEAQTIFTVFDVITIPAFVFAVISRKASTLQIWMTAGWLWGMKMVMIVWYFVSTSDLKIWKAACASRPETAPSQISWGWGAGVLDPWIALPFLLLGAAVLAYWWMLYRRGSRWAMSVAVAGCAALGAGAALFLWAVISRIYCRTEPHALSFQWVGFPVILSWVILGALWLTCGKTQPKARYQGLTLFDAGQPLEEEE